jgi:hypothetical protein
MKRREKVIGDIIAASEIAGKPPMFEAMIIPGVKGNMNCPAWRKSRLIAERRLAASWRRSPS